MRCCPLLEELSSLDARKVNGTVGEPNPSQVKTAWASEYHESYLLSLDTGSTIPNRVLRRFRLVNEVEK